MPAELNFDRNPETKKQHCEVCGKKRLCRDLWGQTLCPDCLADQWPDAYED